MAPLDVVIAGVNKAGTTSLVRLAVRAPVRHAVGGQGDPVLPPRPLREAGRPGRRVPELLRGLPGPPRPGSRRRPSYFYGGAPLARLIDETLPERADHRGAARAGRPRHLVLPVPEDPLAHPAGAPDRGVPRARRHAHRPGLPRPRERALLRDRRQSLRGLPARLARGVRPGPAAGPRLRRAHRRSRPGAARDRDLARAWTRCCSRSTRSRRRTGRWRTRADGSNGSRSR